MMRTITIVCSGASQHSDRSLFKLCVFAGLDAAMVPVQQAQKLWSGSSRASSPRIGCCAISSLTLASLLSEKSNDMAALDIILESLDFMYLYDIAPRGRSDRILRLITDGEVEGVTDPGKRTQCYRFSNSDGEILHELSDMFVTQVNPSSECKLTVSRAANRLKSLISIDNAPFFAHTEKHGCTVFLAARTESVDIDAPVQDDHEAISAISQCLPDLVFLRHVFAGSCWHASALHANFIIDDPYLRREYGSLDFRELAARVNSEGLAATVAFIPWNYRRSSREVVGLFKECSDSLGLCVHGCDHTQGEFATTSMSDLNGMVQDSKRRMDHHTLTTGLPYDQIMVFPQGKFSVEAMRVLKCNDYAAAVNSTAFALNAGDSISVRDLLNPAVMKYHTFPLFVRRYPSNQSELWPIDLFLGKPLLFVEHHAFCRDGCAGFTEVASRVRAQSSRVTWSTLGRIVKNTYQVREEGKGTVRCRVYTNKARVTNQYQEGKTFVVAKEEDDRDLVEMVLINENPVDFRWVDGLIETEVDVDPHQSVALHIVYKDCRIGPAHARDYSYKLRVAIRRRLCDFRDIRLSKSRLLTRLVARTRAMLGR